MADIVIEDPSLVVLIGAAGSGKTTFAARHFEPYEILSSDGFRAMIAGDGADQSVTRAAFGRLHRELTGRLARRQTTVVDATNVERHARQALLRRAVVAGVPAVAIVFDLPGEIVLARNAGRVERVVDQQVVRNHLARLRASIDQPLRNLATEGFDRVIVLRNPQELRDVQVVRVIA